MSALEACVHLQLSVCARRDAMSEPHVHFTKVPEIFSRTFRAPEDVFPEGVLAVACEPPSVIIFFEHVLDGSDDSMFETASTFCSFLDYLPTCSSGDGWLGLSQGCLNRGLELAGGRTR